MKLIQPKVEVITQDNSFVGLNKIIEIAGRTCYKSEDKITENSAKSFVEMLISKEHLSMLEHATVYLFFSHSDTGDVKYYDFPYCKYSVDEKNNSYITTNLRVLYENGWLEDLVYLCDSTEYHEKRITFKFTTQIAISREFNRHRSNSIAEQSTRYCNYNTDKFDNNITINLPSFLKENLYQYINNRIQDSRNSLEYYCKLIIDKKDSLPSNMQVVDYWLFANLACEYSYLNMIKLGSLPQEARTILPLDTNTELVHTAFVEDWQHFCELRTAVNAHPDAKLLALEVEKYLATIVE